MIQKIIALASVLISGEQDAPKPALNKTSAIDALAKIAAPKCQAPESHPLDVVTQIKPLQQIILGYMGHAEFIEQPLNYPTTDKLACNSCYFNWQAFERMNTSVFNAYYPSDPAQRFDHYCEITQHGANTLNAQGTRAQFRDVSSIAITQVRSDTPIAQWNIDHALYNVYAIHSSANGTQLMLCCEPKKQTQLAFLSLRDTLTGIEIKKIENDKHPIVSPRFSPDGKYIAYKAGTSVIVIRADNYEFITEIQQTHAISAIEFFQDSSCIAIGTGRSKTGCVRFYQIIQNPLLT